MKRIFKTNLILLLCWGLSAGDGFVQFAPDVRWDDEIHTYVGFANPLRGHVQVTLTGYAADGSQVAQKVYELDQFERIERSLVELFGTTPVAWIKLESDPLEVGAFVRFEHSSQKAVSTYPFTTYAGTEVWVPHIARETSLFFTEVGIMNASSSEGTASSQPFMDNPDGDYPEQVQASEPLPLPSLNMPGQQTIFEYESLYGDLTSLLQWDRVQTEDMSIAAAQHFGKKTANVNQLASIGLPRTPSHDLIFSHINRDRENFWTGMVLINTKPGILPVKIESYLDDGTVFQSMFVDLQPFEKKSFLVNNTNELGLSDIAAWFRVTSFERTLLGYEIFGSPDDRVMAGMEPAPEPASMLVLPYTPTSETLWTGVGVINPFEEAIFVQIGGFDDAGNMIGVFDCNRLEPNEKRLYTYDEMFGDLAPLVTWSRVDTNRGVVSAFSMTGDRDRQFLSALQASANLSLDGTVFLANFEYDELSYMKDQGWTDVRFNPEVFVPQAQGFSTERWFEAKSGIFQIAFETVVRTFGLPITHESRALMSQLIEIPNDDFDYYISFYLRVVDPELTRHDARFGIVWKEEGSSTYNWYGLSGEYMLSEDQPFDFRDRIEPWRWRNEIHYMTEWMPFEVKLPESAKGKRIQVGPYFSQSTPPDLFYTRVPTPIMFVDVLQISPKQIPLAFELWPEGKGSFIPDSILIQE